MEKPSSAPHWSRPLLIDFGIAFCVVLVLVLLALAIAHAPPSPSVGRKDNQGFFLMLLLVMFALGQFLPVIAALVLIGGLALMIKVFRPG
jgi:4-amino-4-deoxy-L-arabinose transferase-like glycosyltransferase